MSAQVKHREELVDIEAEVCDRGVPPLEGVSHVAGAVNYVCDVVAAKYLTLAAGCRVTDEHASPCCRMLPYRIKVVVLVK